jgi:hypothetical protein
MENNKDNSKKSNLSMVNQNNVIMPKEDNKIIGISFRTLNNEKYLDAEETAKYLKEKGLEKPFSKKYNWIEHNVNEPRKGDIYPGFIKATFRIFLEKMGWEVNNVGDLRISRQRNINNNTYAVFTFFEGRDTNHQKEKFTRQVQTKIKIKKRKEKEKRLRKLRK